MILKRKIYVILCLFVPFILGAQIITLDPIGTGPDDQVTLIFDASQGNKELVGADKIYMHHGVVTDKPTGTAWKYVKGNWGKDDGIGLMTKVEGEANKWKFTFSPDVRSYFGVPPTEDIFRISCVFRSPDGSKKGTINSGEYSWGTVTSNLDMYVNLRSGSFILINQPSASYGLYSIGESLTINATASSNVNEMQLWIDEGNGFESKANVTSGKTIQYSYFITRSVELGIKITATINNEDINSEKTHDIVVRKPTVEEIRPADTDQGVTYFSNPTKVRLSLLAPQKDFVHVVGDFTDWKVKEAYQMKRDGEYYWLDIEGLDPGKTYVYQYWINGSLKIADPYAHQIADPWNDVWIESSVFPNLPEYKRQEYGIASVLQTSQTPYQWSSSESHWQRPDKDHLVIYELHLRDFLKSHSYKDLTDTLTYLKRLGVQAIELMPINEFEGNDSWGYNPSFYFAVDKYYGTKNDLKHFIDMAHQSGMAVILDIVLNHAYGQSPMVQMYFDASANKPAANNPWFYREYVGPYQWGYDFNHDSPYTKKFIDDVNQFWLREFHFDGFRFDFTKGFTSSSFSFDGYNASRIAILKRMADKIREQDAEAYIILEHWGVSNEEKELSDYGMKLWGNRSYDYVPATVGNPQNGSFANMHLTSHVLFYNSHDERRIAEHCLTEGRSQGSYNIKNNEIMYERVKMAAAFTYLQPGPKMIWQFDELGYDIDINFNGRVGSKPLAWGNGSLQYYEDSLRQYIYTTYKAILDLRNIVSPQKLLSATRSYTSTGNTRKLSYASNDFDLLVFGNFGIGNENMIPRFTKTGTWYHYLNGDSIVVTNVNQSFTLRPGEWHIYTTKRYSNGFHEAVEIFDNPVTVSPYPFTLDQDITITFDAKKASKNGSQGLVNAQKVYMHSGSILDIFKPNVWNSTVGTLQDDGLGLMTSKGNDIWEIKIKPRDYYQVPANEEILQIGMYFRNEDNTTFGYGFRNSLITIDVKSSEPIVTITPPNFQAETPIKITYHADRGNRELINATKIYLHSGVSLVDNQTPQINGWQNVVGNWGSDDGIGRMIKVPGTNNWEISFTPKNYYNLSAGETPYWITAVFRNAEGSVKGTGPVGPMPNGFIDSNYDFFIKNAGTVSQNNFNKLSLDIHPNPVSDILFINVENTNHQHVTIWDESGKKVLDLQNHSGSQIKVDRLLNGLYFIIIEQEGLIYSGKFVKLKS
ncbi:MAG: alpha-amylase family glycosyl hydrolase [Saprospiraceae bacterium]